MIVAEENTASAIHLIKWGVRAMLPFAELFLIGWIVWFAFHTDGLAKETQNLLSAIVGGLIVNYTKMSGYIFSRESDETNR
jgi:hypothetical protein